MPARHLLLHWLLLFCLLHPAEINADQSVPQRIITLSPHLAELVFLLGAGDRLRGVSEGSNFPDSVKRIPRIGGAASLDVERVLSLRPDLILAWSNGTPGRDIRQLEQLGLRVVSIEGETLEDIPASLQMLAGLLGTQHTAAALTNRFYDYLKQLADKYRGLPQHKIFIEISSRPLMGLTNRHSFGAGLRLCGLQNIYADAEEPTVIVDLESVLSRGVEFVLLRKEINIADTASRNDFYTVNDSTVQLVGFDADVAFRQTPRLLDAIDQVCSEVHFR